MSARRTARRVAFAFLASALGSAGFVAVFTLDLGAQLQGVTLAVALAGVGSGLVWWSKGLMPPGPFTEERPEIAPPPEEEAAAAEAFRAGEEAVGRRRLLGRLLLLAGGTLGVALLWPVRALGPATRGELRRTAWAPGVRLVDGEGRPVRVDTLQIGGVLTVFPEGSTGAADAQTVLLRLLETDVAEGRETPMPAGHLAYSKLCTHAGCPVGLYQQEAHVLICPCHQAAFDVLAGARPVFGPAVRPLPRLPLGVDDDGVLVALGDFPSPVGPSYWQVGMVHQ